VTLVPIVALLAMWGVVFALRSLRSRLDAHRSDRQLFRSREQMIASIRLRLPPGAELVVIAHQMFFNDARNRDAAAAVLQKNGFGVATTETHDLRSKYWLLARRSVLIDRVPDEIQTVVKLAESYGGTYDDCAPEL
jgi:hypothetical protein